jgi:WD40 repeat protein
MKLTHGFLGLIVAVLVCVPPTAGQGPAGQMIDAPTFEIPANLYRDAAGDLLPNGAIARLGSGRFRHLQPQFRFSPDGKLLLSWSRREPTLRLWEVATGKEIRRLANTGPLQVFDAALSPDNKTLAVVCNRGVALLMDTATAKLRLRLQVITEDIVLPSLFQLAFSPDGQTLASTDGFGEVVLWEANTGKKIARLTVDKAGAKQASGRLTFSADGKQVLGLGQRWEVATGKHLWQPAEDLGDKRLLALSADNRLAAVALSDHWFQLRERATDKVLHEFFGTYAVLQFSPDGTLLAGLSPSWVVRVWNVKTGKCLVEEFLAIDSKAPVVLEFSPDSKILAFAAATRIVLWDVATGKEHWPVTSDDVGCKALISSADGHYLAVEPSRGKLGLWDLAQRQPIVHAVLAEQGCAFTADGSTLVTWGRDGLHHWEASTVKHLRLLPLEEPPRPPSVLAVSSKVYVLATAASRTQLSIKLLDAQTGKALGVFMDEVEDRLGDAIRALQVSADGHTIMVVGDTQIVLRDVRSGAMLRTLRLGRGMTAVSLSADGKTVAVRVAGSGFGLWNVASGKPRLPPWPKAIGATATNFSPDGRFLLVGGADNTIQLWERAVSGKRWDVPTFHGEITQVAFAAQGKLAVSAHEDGTLLLWDFARVDKSSGKAPDKLPKEQLEKQWTDLGSRDPVPAHQATAALAARPGQALPLLKQRLPALCGSQLQAVPQWIENLDSSQLKVREQAAKKLLEIGKFVEPALRYRLTGKPSLELARRLEGLLAQLDEAEAQPPDTEWLQALRAIEVLERLDSTESRQVLKALASLSPETWVSAEARAALQRWHILSGGTK